MMVEYFNLGLACSVESEWFTTPGMCGVHGEGKEADPIT